MISVSYDFYKTVYRGSLDESSFNRLLSKAYKVVSNTTSGRLDTVSDGYEKANVVSDYRMCVCSIVDGIRNSEEYNGRLVKSESVGKVSISYDVSSSRGRADSVLTDIVEFWLGTYGYTSLSWV